VPSKPPFIGQERPETCAIACLRMLLAHHGVTASEAELLVGVPELEGGLSVEDLTRLAEQHGFRAHIEQPSLARIAELLELGTFPIVYLDRSPIDGEFSVHAVVPIRVTRRFVVVLDPLRGERRISQSKFEAGWRRLACICLVCQV
jgi:ABC-type bacteriocin/lantibiotic exporter with double-glycine peptidase domain